MRELGSKIGNISELQAARSSLVALDEGLGRLTGSADQVFLEIGNALSQSVTIFGTLGGDLTGLAEHLHGQEAGNAVLSLEQAVRNIQKMSSSGDIKVDDLLQKLDSGATEVGKRLALLRAIIVEVRALAINGKIQSSMVKAAGVDFTVFNTEIGRLGQLAEQSVEQVDARLVSVREAISSARAASANFERNEAKELETVRARIETSLAVLAERRKRAAVAADSVAESSKAIARHIASTVSELQINDSVCQRLEHIRLALKTADSLVTGGATLDPRHGWLVELPKDRHPLTISALCRLQAGQLKGAAKDYRTEVEGLERNLVALATEAYVILSRAEEAFGGGNGGLFITEIERDIERATSLLAAYGAAHERARSVVATVTECFQAMETDLAAIQSIDADMRVMGLNATLKCGRLGNEGRALGVVAQELRACSKRTEDNSHRIAERLGNVLDLSGALATASKADGNLNSQALIEVMDSSMSALAAMGGRMTDALAGFRADAGGVSKLLAKTAAGIEVHRQVEAASEGGATNLISIADSIAAEMDIDLELHKDMHRLMQPHYTMDAERIIHQTFAKDDSAAAMIEAAKAKASENVDDMFF
jgi:hypothetical protein